MTFGKRSGLGWDQTSPSIPYHRILGDLTKFEMRSDFNHIKPSHRLGDVTIFGMGQGHWTPSPVGDLEMEIWSGMRFGIRFSETKQDDLTAACKDCLLGIGESYGLTAQHVRKIIKSLYDWKMYINENKALPPYVNSSATRGSLSQFQPYCASYYFGHNWQIAEFSYL